MVARSAVRGRISSSAKCALDRTVLEVQDYEDNLSPVLNAMHATRLPSYATLGFDTGKQRRRS